MRHARFSRIRAGVVAALLVLTAGALAACGSPAASSPSGGGETHTVTITGNSFGDDFTIAAGDSVEFVNDAGVDHTVTNGVEGEANEDPLFDEELAAGETSDPIVFDEPGTYDVTCRIHPSMQLAITVE
jgi:plastocyanin